MRTEDRRHLVIGFLLIVVVLFSSAVIAFAHSFTTAAAATEVDLAYVEPRSQLPPIAPDVTGRPLVALTFDDGPTPDRTPYVLDVLRSKGVRATFFIQGDQAAAHPDLVGRIRDDGHVIGNHSQTHPWFPGLDPAAAEEEIVRAKRTLEQLTGSRPTLFRYPFGEASPAGDAALRRLGLTGGVLWHWESSLPGDFECPGSSGMTDFVVTEAADQALILLHDASDVLECPPEQWDYLARSIDELRAKGFGFGVVVPADRPSRLNQGSSVAVVP